MKINIILQACIKAIRRLTNCGFQRPPNQLRPKAVITVSVCAKEEPAVVLLDDAI